MKKIGILLLLCSFLLTGLAQSGTLLISSPGNQRFWLVIDDVLQNEYSVPSIKITGMRYQNYKIRVEMDNSTASCVGQSVTITNQYYGDNFLVSYKSGGYVITRTQTNVRPALTQSLIQPNYNHYEGYYQYMYPGFGNPGNYWQGSSNNQGNPYQFYQHPQHGDGNYGNYPPVVHPQNPPQTPPGGGMHGNRNCRDSREFALALSAIQKEAFESGKLQFAKSMTQSGAICVEQIIQICNTFTFESSKLEYAKFAYAYCSDSNLYYMVNNVFQFQASKDELTKFIR